MKLSLGPIQYFWDRDTVYDFYGRIAHAPVDIVYLGETVCAKRRALRLRDWLEIAQMLRDHSKEVVLSTLALLEAESELGMLKQIVDNGRFPVEANDMGAVNLLAGRRAFVAGPHINSYNVHTLAILAQAGARRWVMPVELDRRTLAALQRDRPPGMETEVFGFGRLPLAFSARCFTARANNLQKDDCGFRCADFPDGMLLQTREGKSFLVLNGIQVQSAATHNLLPHLAALKGLGVDVLRLSPQSRGMSDVIDAFRRALDAGGEPQLAGDALAHCAPDGFCDGYWCGQAGMSQLGRECAGVRGAALGG